jgi:hypothetical protein
MVVTSWDEGERHEGKARGREEASKPQRSGQGERAAGRPAGLQAAFLFLEKQCGAANLLRGDPASDLDGEHGLLHCGRTRAHILQVSDKEKTWKKSCTLYAENQRKLLEKAESVQKMEFRKVLLFKELGDFPVPDLRT